MRASQLMNARGKKLVASGQPSSAVMTSRTTQTSRGPSATSSMSSIQGTKHRKSAEHRKSAGFTLPVTSEMVEVKADANVAEVATPVSSLASQKMAGNSNRDRTLFQRLFQR